MGFLDNFDNPDWIGSILGMGTAQAATNPPAPAPAPAPPQSPGAPMVPPSGVLGGGGSLFSPQSTMGQMGQMRTAAVPPGPPPPAPLTFQERAQPVQDAIAAGPAGGGFDMEGANATNFPRPPARGQPQPRVQLAQNGPPQGGPPLPPPQITGPPLPTARNNPLENALAGLGKGLTAASQMKPGSFAGANFAAGMGGAVTGGVEATKQARNDLFNQSSTAFKDMLASERAGDEHTLSQAKSRYYDAWSAQRAAGGAGGTNSWRDHPYYRAMQLERQLDNIRRQRLDGRKQLITQGALPEDFKKYDDETEKLISRERASRAKSYGIDPNTYKLGTSYKDAFDIHSLTPQQRNEMMDGAWFRYKDPKNQDGNLGTISGGQEQNDGYTYKVRDWLKNPPYPGWEPPASSSAVPQRQGPSPAEAERTETDIG